MGKSPQASPKSNTERSSQKYLPSKCPNSTDAARDPKTATHKSSSRGGSAGSDERGGRGGSSQVKKSKLNSKSQSFNTLYVRLAY